MLNLYGRVFKGHLGLTEKTKGGAFDSAGEDDQGREVWVGILRNRFFKSG